MVEFYGADQIYLAWVYRVYFDDDLIDLVFIFTKSIFAFVFQYAQELIFEEIFDFRIFNSDIFRNIIRIDNFETILI